MCGLPQEVCICQEIAKEQQKAVISVVRRRYGKMVTIVEGIDDSAIDLGQLAKIPVSYTHLTLPTNREV
mgnify:CR=1 FL=1